MKEEIKKKIKNYPLLKRCICEILDGDISEFSAIVQTGIAILLIIYKESVTGEKEASTFIPYLIESDIDCDGRTLNKVLRIISANNLVSDNKINIVGTEEVESPITWAMWASLFDGNISRTVKNGEAYYKITKRGIRAVKNMMPPTN